MKKLLLLAISIMAVSAVKAQDIIVMKNAEEIQAKVTAIAPESISYKKWGNLEGPSYTMYKSEIFYIKYQNGDKEIMENITTPHRTSIKRTTEDFTQSKFQGYTYLGADFNSILGGPSLDFSFGVRTSKYFYIGGGIGWHNLLGSITATHYDYDGNYYSETFTIWTPYLTFTSDIKAYIPTQSDFYPRVDLSYGGVVFPDDESCGFYMSFGAGFDWRKFSFGIGYQMPVLYSTVAPLGYVKVGYRFGKK